MQLDQRIGAYLTPEGCFFRVWAPHVDEVCVLTQPGAGQSAKVWNPAAESASHPLSREPGGYFSGTIADIGPGMLYRFQLSSPDRVFERIDPAARDVVHSALTGSGEPSDNAAIVVDSTPYPWVPFATPRFENFLIYQFHVGSFAGRHDHLNKSIATFADIETKLPYVRELGFNAIQPLPVQEFALDRSWGYNPASYFAPESAYGTPDDLKHLVDTAHDHGLAVIFDVVYNHAGPGDNVLWEFDGYAAEGGIYFEGGQQTAWGRGPAWWKQEVQDYFYQNARMYFEDYNADGLRFDCTTAINGNYLRAVVWRLREEYPEKYLIAEHLPAHTWVTTLGNFHATWNSDVHHQVQRALAGDAAVDRVLGVLQRGAFEHAWNLVHYPLGSHDDCGDPLNGNAEDGLQNWDSRHRYLIDLLGGRHSDEARAKCRLAWVLGVTMPGTPMCFMGSECLLGSPHVAWGYWHDGVDQWGDHRFDWSVAGDAIGLAMRSLVSDANELRWDHDSLRNDDCRVVHVDRERGIVAYVREQNGDRMLMVLNLSGNTYPADQIAISTGGLGGQWRELLASNCTLYSGPYTLQSGSVAVEGGTLRMTLPAWNISAWQQVGV